MSISQSMLKFLAVLLTAFVSIGGSLDADTIYVDSTFEGSSDGTMAAPFVLIQDALDLALPGDEIRIRGGSASFPFVYFEEGLIVDVPGLTITNWNSDVFRPWISGTLSLDPAINAPSPGLDVFRITASEVTLSNLVVLNAWYAGISVRFGGQEILETEEMIFGIVIEDCVTYATGSSGIFLKNTADIVVQRNTIIRAVQRYAQECLTIFNVHGFDVVDKVVPDRPRYEGSIGGEGIDAKDGSKDGLIRRNRVTNIERKFGIYVDGYREGCSNIQVYNNFVRGCGSGLSVASEVGGETTDISLHGNIVLECAAGMFFGPHQVGYSHPVRNVEVMFNTFIRNNGYGINVANSDLDGIKINNNIMLENTGLPIRLRPGVDPNLIGLEFQNNMFVVGNTGFGPGNIGLTDSDNQLQVQRYPIEDERWDDPSNYYPLRLSAARNSGWDSLIGDPIEQQNGTFRRLDISGSKRKSDSVVPPGGFQDVGAREADRRSNRD